MAYILQIIAFQLVFLVVYDLFLKKETFFHWNRIYLIGSSILSFILPLIKLESFQEVVPREYVIMLPTIILTPEKTIEAVVPSWNWYVIIGIGVSTLLFLYKITQLIRLKLKGIVIHKGSYKIIKIPKSTLAFSIFNYVFIGEEIKEDSLEDIVSHELIHVRDRHSIDLLYFEILRILCWFNPFVYIYQKRIAELHEFIADAAVIKHKNKSDYYEKLLAEVFQTQQFSFINQFFKHSLIKKRIVMLTKQKSRAILKLKYLLLLPVLVGLLTYTSCSTQAVTDSDTEEVITKNVTKEDVIAVQEKFKTHSMNIDLGKSGIIKRTNEAIKFIELDKAPIFPGCEEQPTLEALKDCFNRKVQIHVNSNFDMKLASSLNLQGRVKIYAMFVVDTEGELVDIKVRAPHPQLETEVRRVINMLPKLKPGMKDGKAVKVSYTLPIIFKLKE